MTTYPPSSTMECILVGLTLYGLMIHTEDSTFTAGIPTAKVESYLKCI